MIISEVGEANIFRVPTTIDQIIESNMQFAEAIAMNVDGLTNINAIVDHYTQIDSPVVDFNKVRIYHSESQENYIDWEHVE
jgi:hypothetical protein